MRPTRPSNGADLQATSEEALKLGLDLQGGMHVTLEVGTGALLKELAGTRADETFDAALATATQQAETSGDDYVTLFAERRRGRAARDAPGPLLPQRRLRHHRAVRQRRRRGLPPRGGRGGAGPRRGDHPPAHRPVRRHRAADPAPGLVAHRRRAPGRRRRDARPRPAQGHGQAHVPPDAADGRDPAGDRPALPVLRGDDQTPRRTTTTRRSRTRRRPPPPTRPTSSTSATSRPTPTPEAEGAQPARRGPPADPVGPGLELAHRRAGRREPTRRGGAPARGARRRPAHPARRPVPVHGRPRRRRHRRRRGRLLPRRRQRARRAPGRDRSPTPARTSTRTRTPPRSR